LNCLKPSPHYKGEKSRLSNVEISVSTQEV
jgi:hypothetical protein